MTKKKTKPKKSIPSGKRKAGKMKSQGTKKVAQVAPEGPENIDKIRDILFGSQSRDIDKRFARLEELVRRELRSMEVSTTQRLDSLEDYFKGEIESLVKQLKTENKERTTSDDDLKGKLKDTQQLLEKKTIALDQQMTKGQGDLRQQLLERSKKLNDDMQKKYKEIMKLLETSVQELRTEKTDRLALADLLMGVALQLKKEFKIPGRK